MGLTSENVAAAYGIPRDRQDIMAADSHKKVGPSPGGPGGPWLRCLLLNYQGIFGEPFIFFLDQPIEWSGLELSLKRIY